MLAGLLPALMLQACDRRVSPAPDGSAAGSPTGSGTSAPGDMVPAAAPPPGITDGLGIDEGNRDPAPTPLAPGAEKGVEGARNELLAFARAIELRKFAQARAMLSPADRNTWSNAEFARIFVDLGKITVAVPDGTMEGAAGSSYFTAPVTITAIDKHGRPVRIEDEAVLRRVIDVDGATLAQLRWRFATLTLDWKH